LSSPPTLRRSVFLLTTRQGGLFRIAAAHFPSVPFFLLPSSFFPCNPSRGWLLLPSFLLHYLCCFRSSSRLAYAVLLRSSLELTSVSRLSLLPDFRDEHSPLPGLLVSDPFPFSFCSWDSLRVCSFRRPLEIELLLFSASSLTFSLEKSRMTCVAQVCFFRRLPVASSWSTHPNTPLCFCPFSLSSCFPTTLFTPPDSRILQKPRGSTAGCLLAQPVSVRPRSFPPPEDHRFPALCTRSPTRRFYSVAVSFLRVLRPCDYRSRGVRTI